MKIHEALRATLREYGISQAELARRSGLTQSDISLFINNNRNTGHEKIDLMLDALPSEARRYYGALVGDFFRHCAA